MANTFKTLRAKTISAGLTRASELAGPPRQRYTTLPRGTNLHEDRTASWSAVRKFIDSRAEARLVSGGVFGYVTEHLDNPSEMARDIRVQAQYVRTYWFIAHL